MLIPDPDFSLFRTPNPDPQHWYRYSFSLTCRNIRLLNWNEKWKFHAMNIVNVHEHFSIAYLMEQAKKNMTVLFCCRWICVRKTFRGIVCVFLSFHLHYPITPQKKFINKLFLWSTIPYYFDAYCNGIPVVNCTTVDPDPVPRVISDSIIQLANLTA